MLLNEYFETISFAQGAQFNVSHAIDADYMNKLHWHPFVEILVAWPKATPSASISAGMSLASTISCCCTPAICTASRAAAQTRI